MTAREVPVGIWLTTDAALDNVAAVERLGGDANVAGRAESLRERGWSANSRHPQRGSVNFGWPPPDEVLEIELTTADLDFIREVLDRIRNLSVQTVNSLDTGQSARKDQTASLRMEDEAIDFWER